MLPVSAKQPVRFIPLAAQIDRTRRQLAGLRELYAGLVEAPAPNQGNSQGNGQKTKGQKTKGKNEPAGPLLTDEALKKRQEDLLAAAQDQLEAMKRRLADNPDQPAYLVAAATVFERANFRPAMLAHGCLWPDTAELLRVLRAAIPVCVEDHQHAALVELLDQAELLGDESSWTFDVTAGIDSLTAQLRGLYPDLDRLLAARSRWTETAPLVAAQMFLRGWENVRDRQGCDLPFQQRAGRVTDDCLTAMPLDDLVAVGQFALALMQGLTEEQEKN